MELFFNKIIKKKIALPMLGAGLALMVFILTIPDTYKKNNAVCPVLENGQASRIVSTSLASDEIISAMLDRAGQRDRLIAVSRHVDSPAYSNMAGRIPLQVARVGDNLEALSGLQPDLVIFASFNRPELSASLARMGTRTCSLERFASLHDIRTNILAIGAATGFSPEARDIAAAFDVEIKSIADTTRLLSGATSFRDQPVDKPKVLSFDGSGSVMGAQTTFDDLVNLAGGVNAAAEAGLSGWPQVNPEAVAAMAPDVIVLIGEKSEIENLKERAANLPGWRDTPAVRNRHYATPETANLLALSPAILEAVQPIRAALIRATTMSLQATPGDKQ